MSVWYVLKQNSRTNVYTYLKMITHENLVHGCFTMIVLFCTEWFQLKNKGAKFTSQGHDKSE